MSTIKELVAVLSANTADFDTKMGKSSSLLGGIGGIASKAAGIAVGALGAISAVNFAQGVADNAVKIDTSMREVFTLLPGITQEAMTQMTTDVLNFGGEFGVLATDSIPAVYQALSAGVPQGNLFDFLETAQAAAVGGVTSLETSVDALSTVVNAYGTDVITASEASDLIFTAVRLGKTTFDEMGSSIGKVIPTMASAGVGFDQVAASVAALTAQGISTSESVTGLKATMSNIIKPTADMQGAIDSVVTSFASASTENAALVESLLAQGNSYSQVMLQTLGFDGAIAALTETTGGNQEKLAGMFGSVEALNTVLALTSEGGALKFKDALTAMDTSSGATNTAFETMAGGVEFNMDRIKAGFEGVIQKITLAVMPTVSNMVSGFADQMPLISSAVDTALVAISGSSEAIKTAINAAITFIKDVVNTVITALGTDSQTLVADLTELGASLSETLTNTFTLIKTLWETILKPTIEAISPLIKTAFEDVKTIIKAAVTIINETLTLITALLNGDFTTAWNSLKTIIETAMNAAKTVISEGVEAWKTTFGKILEPLNQLGKDMVQGIVNGITGKVTDVVTAIENMSNSMLTKLRNFWGWNSPATLLASFGADFIQGIINGIAGGVQGVVSAIGNMSQSMLDKLKGFWDWNSPTGLTEDFGADVAKGVAVGIDENADLPEKAVDDMSQKILKGFGDVTKELSRLPGQWGEAFGIMNELINDTVNIMQAFSKGLVDGIVATVATGFKWLVNFLSGVNAKAREIADSISKGIEGGIAGSLDEVFGKVYNSFNEFSAAFRESALESVRKTVQGMISEYVSGQLIMAKIKPAIDAVGQALANGVGTESGMLAYIHAIANLKQDVAQAINDTSGTAYLLNEYLNEAFAPPAGSSQTTQVAQSQPQTIQFNVDGRTLTQIVGENLGSVVQLQLSGS